jgi:hypothetical protein
LQPSEPFYSGVIDAAQDHQRHVIVRPRISHERREFLQKPIADFRSRRRLPLDTGAIHAVVPGVLRLTAVTPPKSLILIGKPPVPDDTVTLRTLRL